MEPSLQNCCVTGMASEENLNKICFLRASRQFFEYFTCIINIIVSILRHDFSVPEGLKSSKGNPSLGVLYKKVGMLPKYTGYIPCK